MDLRPSELQDILRTAAEDFFEREVSFERIREIEAAGRPDEQLQAQMTELGWNSLAISEAYGGQGGTVLDAAVLITQICRAALPSPLASTLVGAVTIERHGDEELKTSLLPQLDSGLTISPALLEASDSLYGDVTAEYAGGAVTGEKRFVEFGETSDVHLVAAMHGDAPGLAVVRRDQAGVTARDTRTIGALPQATVNYDGASAEAWIEGADAVETLRRLGAAVAAFESYAYAQKALDLTVDYVQMRVQFGQPIGAFQAVQMRCADMATIVEGSRFLTHELLWQIDEGLETRRQVAVVKAITAKMAPQVLQDCHLLHGGIGYMQEYDLHFFTRRGRDAALRWGSARETMHIVTEEAFAAATPATTGSLEPPETVTRYARITEYPPNTYLGETPEEEPTEQDVEFEFPEPLLNREHSEAFLACYAYWSHKGIDRLLLWDTIVAEFEWEEEGEKRFEVRHASDTLHEKTDLIWELVSVDTQGNATICNGLHWGDDDEMEILAEVQLTHRPSIASA